MEKPTFGFDYYWSESGVKLDGMGAMEMAFREVAQKAWNAALLQAHRDIQGIALQLGLGTDSDAYLCDKAVEALHSETTT